MKIINSRRRIHVQLAWYCGVFQRSLLSVVCWLLITKHGRCLTLTMHVQKHHNRRTVANIIGCLARVSTMLTSWRVLERKELVVCKFNPGPVWEAPLYAWWRITSSITKQVCFERFVNCKISVWRKYLRGICKRQKRPLLMIQHIFRVSN